jgi:cell division transport system permease protein
MSGSGLSAWSSRHAHALFSSMGRLARHPLATVLTVLVMALAIALPLGLNRLVSNVRAATGDFSGAIGLSAYLHLEVPEERIQQLARSAREHAGVGRVEIISATAALEQFRKESGFGAALDALTGNPLPPVISVTPTATASSPAEVETLRRYLAAWPEVESVQLDGDWVVRFNAILDELRDLLLLAAVLLGAGVIAVVGNTIRLEIDNRRAEIEVTKLVGGTNAFVRRPFLYAGTLYGLLAGLAAWLIVAAATLSLQPATTRLALAYGSHFVLNGPDLREAGLALALGTLLGWLGAWLAAARHLAQIEPGFA